MEIPKRVGLRERRKSWLVTKVKTLMAAVALRKLSCEAPPAGEVRSFSPVAVDASLETVL